MSMSRPASLTRMGDRKGGVEGKRVDLGGRRIIKKKREEDEADRGRNGEEEGEAHYVREGRAKTGGIAAGDGGRDERERVFFSSRRRHTRCLSDWSSDVCSSD